MVARLRGSFRSMRYDGGRRWPGIGMSGLLYLGCCLHNLKLDKCELMEGLTDRSWSKAYSRTNRLLLHNWDLKNPTENTPDPVLVWVLKDSVEKLKRGLVEIITQTFVSGSHQSLNVLPWIMTHEFMNMFCFLPPSMHSICSVTHLDRFSLKKGSITFTVVFFFVFYVVLITTNEPNPSLLTRLSTLLDLGSYCENIDNTVACWSALLPHSSWIMS